MSDPTTPTPPRTYDLPRTGLNRPCASRVQAVLPSGTVEALSCIRTAWHRAYCHAMVCIVETGQRTWISWGGKGGSARVAGEPFPKPARTPQEMTEARRRKREAGT